MKIRIIQEQWFWRWVFKVFKRSRKPTAEKSSLENVRFLSLRTFFVGKYGIQSNFTRVFDFPPSDLMRPRYCRSADARMRMQNALLLCKPIVNLKQWEWGIPTDGSWILSKISFRPRLYLREGERRFFFSSKSAYCYLVLNPFSTPVLTGLGMRAWSPGDLFSTCVEELWVEIGAEPSTKISISHPANEKSVEVSIFQLQQSKTMETFKQFHCLMPLGLLMFGVFWWLAWIACFSL